MIGDTIRMMRSERCLSIEAVAEGIGVSELAIEQYEKNIWRPGTPTLQKLAKFFGVNIEEIKKGYQLLYDETNERILVARPFSSNQFRVIESIDKKGAKYNEKFHD